MSEGEKYGRSAFDADKINNQLNELNKIYNTGVDACIEIIKRRKGVYNNANLSRTEEATFMYLFDKIITQFEQLKKPLQ